MAIRLSTTLDKIYSVPNPDNSRIIRDFYEYMKANGTSENYQNQNLKAMICAHIFLKVESFGIKNNKIFARLYRSNRIKKGQNRGESFGKDERGETTFSERLYEFHSTKIKGIIESSTSIENPLDTTVHLNVELYYGDIEPSLEDFSRPFKSQPPLSGNIKEIIKKKKKLRQIYNRAKIENNSYIKGALLECSQDQERIH